MSEEEKDHGYETNHEFLNAVVEDYIDWDDWDIDQESGEIVKPYKTMAMPQYDSALIGYSVSDKGGIQAVYSMEAIIECLCDDMTEEDALEYFYFNIAGSYLENSSESNDKDDDSENQRPIMPLILHTFSREF